MSADNGRPVACGVTGHPDTCTCGEMSLAPAEVQLIKTIDDERATPGEVAQRAEEWIGKTVLHTPTGRRAKVVGVDTRRDFQDADWLCLDIHSLRNKAVSQYALTSEVEVIHDEATH